jgi:hypothetical protein
LAANHMALCQGCQFLDEQTALTTAVQQSMRKGIFPKGLPPSQRPIRRAFPR